MISFYRIYDIKDIVKTDERKSYKMKSCVVYYSKTGNTKGVAKQLKDVDLLEIQAESDDPNVMNPVLTEIPDIKDYDYVIFATPVHGFQMSKIMQAYLNQLPSLKGKVIYLFITHFFPFAWMGGNVTLKQMKKIIEQKEGQVRLMTSINWKNRHREDVIQQVVTTYHV